MIKNYGFDEKKVFISADDYIFGAHLEQKVIRADKNWESALPQYEPQTLPDGEDEDGCTIWGLQNCIETYMKEVFGFEPNYSERYNYNLANIVPPGANPKDGAQTVRDYGLIPQESLPVPNTLAEFMTPRPMEQKYIDQGRLWGYTFNYEWIVSDDMKSAIIDSLQYSPAGVAVTAWIQDENGYYIDGGQPSTHWCEAFGTHTTPDGKVGLKIFDSYDQSIKLLHPDHRISFAMRYLITKQDPVVVEKIGLIQKILGYMYQLLELLKAQTYGRIFGTTA